LALVWSHRAVRNVGVERGVRELFISKPFDWPAAASCTTAPVAYQENRLWRRAVAYSKTTVSKILARCERNGWIPLRRKALHRAESQLLRNIDGRQLEQLDYFQLIWHAIALHAIGYGKGSSAFQACQRQLRKLVHLDVDADVARIQLRTSLVTDTTTALVSLGASGTAPNHPCAMAAAEWLRQKLRQHDSNIAVLDLAAVLHSMWVAADFNSRGANDALPPQLHLCRRGGKWVRHRASGWSAHVQRLSQTIIGRFVQQQNADGGWSATADGESAPDVTGAVLEALAAPAGQSPLPTADRAIGFLRRTQRADGSWDSATAVRFTHGTSLAVRGLSAAGIPPEDDAIAAGINWILVHQHPSGGWGESVRTSPDSIGDDFVPAPATASQTAWALLALVSAGRWDDPAVRRGLDFLVQTQQHDGGWHETQFVLRDAATGRWFQNELHSAAGPLLALARWAVAAAASHARHTDHVSLRLVGTTADE
jgi:squalene-hopene/tetraprenyl-beta-curcumene cyclase